MSYLSRRLNNSSKGLSVYKSIIEKNTDPTTESILSFTEREFVRCFPDIKFAVENTRFENGKMPFCGEQFLEDLDDEVNNKSDYLLIKSDPDGQAIKKLDKSDLRHLKGVPMRGIENIRDKDEVQGKFQRFAEHFYPAISGFDDNKCDKPTDACVPINACNVCPKLESQLMQRETML